MCILCHYKQLSAAKRGNIKLALKSCIENDNVLNKDLSRFRNCVKEIEKFLPSVCPITISQPLCSDIQMWFSSVKLPVFMWYFNTLVEMIHPFQMVFKCEFLSQLSSFSLPKQSHYLAMPFFILFFLKHIQDLY